MTANPIWGIVKLFLGCCAFVFSVCILIQIVFYKLIRKDNIPHNEFLNDLFVFFEFTLARFISSIAFTALAVYILITVVKGNFKFGMRFMLVVPFHPMKVGRTFMNSILVNLFLIMLATPAVLHFIIELFEAYMRLTTGAFIFATLVENMKFFKWFYQSKFFFYVYLAFALLTLIYLLFKPNSDRYNLKKMIEERKKIRAVT